MLISENLASRHSVCGFLLDNKKTVKVVSKSALLFVLFDLAERYRSSSGTERRFSEQWKIFGYPTKICRGLHLLCFGPSDG